MGSADECVAPGGRQPRETNFRRSCASRSGPRLPDAPCAELVLLPQGRRLMFSPTGKRATKKKKETRKRGRRKNISFRADSKFRGPKSQRFLNPKVFVLSSAPFLTMLRRRRAPSWDLPCACTLTSSGPVYTKTM